MPTMGDNTSPEQDSTESGEDKKKKGKEEDKISTPICEGTDGKGGKDS